MLVTADMYPSAAVSQEERAELRHAFAPDTVVLYQTQRGGQPMYRHHTPTHITTHGEEGNRCIDIILRHTLPHTGRRAADV